MSSDMWFPVKINSCFSGKEAVNGFTRDKPGSCENRSGMCRLIWNFERNLDNFPSGISKEHQHIRFLFLLFAAKRAASQRLGKSTGIRDKAFVFQVPGQFLFRI